MEPRTVGGDGALEVARRGDRVHHLVGRFAQVTHARREVPVGAEQRVRVAAHRVRDAVRLKDLLVDAGV